MKNGTIHGSTAVVLDWSEPFATRVLSRIHEYDDRWPKPHNVDTVVLFNAHKARRRRKAIVR
jgi:hypothetical protein